MGDRILGTPAVRDEGVVPLPPLGSHWAALRGGAPAGGWPPHRCRRRCRRRFCRARRCGKVCHGGVGSDRSGQFRSANVHGGWRGGGGGGGRGVPDDTTFRTPSSWPAVGTTVEPGWFRSAVTRTGPNRRDASHGRRHCHPGGAPHPATTSRTFAPSTCTGLVSMLVGGGWGEGTRGRACESPARRPPYLRQTRCHPRGGTWAPLSPPTNMGKEALSCDPVIMPVI